MFPNEVLIDKIEKEKLVELATEENKILEQYEYSSDYSHHFTQDIDYHRVLKQIKVKVAKEIFDEIEKLVSTNKKTVGCATYEETIFYIKDFIEDLAELKKKYIGE